MTDKRTSLDEAVSSIESGMTIGIGGWGGHGASPWRSSARCCAPTSPTSPSSPTAVQTLACCARRARSSASTTASCRWTRPPFYDPWFAKARTTGAIEAREMDEGMLRCGLQAAAQRLPFLPIRAGLGSDVRTFWGVTS